MSNVEIDQAELLRRVSAHPVAGPYVQVVMRDLALEQAHARIAELEAAAGASDG